MTTMVAIKLLGPASGHPTEFDGHWLVEYDPTREGVSPSGQPMTAHIVTTDDRTKAKWYASATEAHAAYMAESGRPYPRNRPLTAFDVELDQFTGLDEQPRSGVVVVTHSEAGLDRLSRYLDESAGGPR